LKIRVKLKSGHISASIAMPPTTDTDLKEMRDLIIGLREEVRVGFAQVGTKLAQMDTKLFDLKGEVNTRLPEIKGDLKIVKQPIEFWDFVERSLLLFWL
jgi:hypothetical protein